MTVVKNCIVQNVMQLKNGTMINDNVNVENVSKNMFARNTKYGILAYVLSIVIENVKLINIKHLDIVNRAIHNLVITSEDEP